MEVGVVVTVAIALAAVIFHAGRLNARVESLESWRAEVRHEFNRVHDELSHIASLITEGKG